MSIIYPKAGTKLLKAALPDLSNGATVFKASIGRQSAYTVGSPSTSAFKSDVTTVQDASAALASITLTTPQEATVNAANITFSAVTAGAALDFLLLWFALGGASTADPILAYFDGFSVTPNGGDITIVWDTGTPRILKLV